MNSSDALLYSLVLGIAVAAFTYVGLSRSAHDPSTRRALAVATFSIGMAVTWYFYKSPSLLHDIVERIAYKGVDVVLVALGAAVLFWKLLHR